MFRDIRSDTALEPRQVVGPRFDELMMAARDDFLDHFEDLAARYNPIVRRVVRRTRPMLEETADVVTKDIPDALGDVQEAMPSVIEAAAVIDDAMRVLSQFNYEIPKLLSDDKWIISLGVEYNPAIPLDQALQNLSDKLETIPEDLRGVEDDLDNADVNLVIISDDLMDVASDLEVIQAQMADVNPQIKTISSNLLDLQESIRETQSRIPDVFEITQKWFIGIMVFVIASQLPSIYIGWVIALKKNP